MSRLREDPSGSENDEFPDLDTLVHQARKVKKSAALPSTKTTKASSVRRRKLSPLADNVLLKPWTQEPASQIHHDIPPSTGDITKPRSRTRVQLRTRKQGPTQQITAITDIDNDEQGDGNNDLSVEVALDDRASADDSSEFHDTVSLGQYGSDDSNDGPTSKYPVISASPSKQSKPQGHGRTTAKRKISPKQLGQPVTADESGKRQSDAMALSRLTVATLPEADLVGAINRLRM